MSFTMFSCTFSPPNPPLLSHKNYYSDINNYENSPTNQIHFTTLFNSSALVISKKNKNLGSCTRNRFGAVCSLNEEKEEKTSKDENGAQFASRKIDAGLGNGGSNSSTSFLTFLCPLLKLFSVSILFNRFKNEY